MRTTLTIDDDVYEAARTLAAGSGESLGAIISQLARRGLRPAPSSAPEEDALPTFSVPPEAKIIPGDRAAELLAEEGTE